MPPTNDVPQQGQQPEPEQPVVLQQPGPAPLLTPSPRKARLFTLVAVVLSITALIAAAVVYMQKAALDKESEEAAPVARVNIVARSGFSPSTIKVKKGQTVMWTNTDSQPRNLAAVNAEENQSGPEGFGTDDQLGQGETYAFSFEDVGTYTYNDPVNPLGTNGTVIVEE